MRMVAYPTGPLDDRPGDELAALQPGDALLVVNYFGLAACQPVSAWQERGAEVIEDHTHDPWSPWATTSQADWCVASLRKTLPLPDGGVLWSPSHHPLPPETALTETHYRLSLEKYAAMALKAFYLGGGAIGKDVFRGLMTSTEQRLGTGEPSGISPISAALLGTFPIGAWRARRRANYDAFCRALGDQPDWVTVMTPVGEGACPFAVVLLVDSSARQEHLRRRLIENRVYPAVLWPLSDPVVTPIPDAHVRLSRQLLVVHCDMRYDETDMAEAARLVRSLGGEVG
jgi:hypothetical protein